MWYNQLSRQQKWEFSGLALAYGGLLLGVPFTLAFNGNLLPFIPLEILSSFLLFRLTGKRPSATDLPWITAAVFFPDFSLIAMLSLVRPQAIKKLWEQHNWFPPKYQLLAGGSVLFLITHTIACGWLLIQPPELSNSFDKYVWGFYWTVTTLATVGYGDITPQTSLARFYAMGIMMVGVSSFAIFVSHFSRLLISRDSKQEAQKVKMKHLQEMLTRYQIPFKLRHEIFHLYQHILDHKGMDEEEKILGELPLGLRENLEVHIRTFSISKLDIFQNLSPECLEMIARNFEDRFYNAGENIVSQGDIGREMFVVHHGEVEIWRDSQKLNQLKEGNVFGEMALLEATARNAMVIAKKYSHILILTDEAFARICEQHPEFRKKLESIHQERKIA